MKIAQIILAACAAGVLWGKNAYADDSTLSAPVRSVYGNYLKIQASLANDSMNGVAENANYIAKAVRADENALPTGIASEADHLAEATDLSSARAAFKTLSNSLIQYLNDHNVKGAYVQFFCPMAAANWLQTDKSAKNPYLGRAMSGCGEIINATP